MNMFDKGLSAYSEIPYTHLISENLDSGDEEEVSSINGNNKSLQHTNSMAVSKKRLGVSGSKLSSFGGYPGIQTIEKIKQSIT